MNTLALQPVFYFWLSFIGVVLGILFAGTYVETMPFRARLKLLLALAQLEEHLRIWLGWVIFEIIYLCGRCRKAVRFMLAPDNRHRLFQSPKRRAA
jgi:hypothetical protein